MIGASELLDTRTLSSPQLSSSVPLPSKRLLEKFCIIPRDTARMGGRILKTMPTDDSRSIYSRGQLTVWGVADELSVLTGIWVRGWQEGVDLDLDRFRKHAGPIDLEDFRSGRVRPAGAVILYSDRNGVLTLWELSPMVSQIVLQVERSLGPVPGALASLLRQ